jgi:hypothetical protein
MSDENKSQDSAPQSDAGETNRRVMEEALTRRVPDEMQEALG